MRYGRCFALFILIGPAGISATPLPQCDPPAMDSACVLNLVELSRNFLSSNNDSAYSYAEKALCIATSLENDYLVAAAKDQKGSVFTEIGAWDKAIKAFNEALGTRVLNQWYPEAGETHLHLGNLYKSEGEVQEVSRHFEAADQSFELAFNNYQKAVEKFNIAQDTLGLARAYSNLGVMYYRTYDKEKALENYTKSAAIFRAIGAESFLAGVMSNIGVVYQAMGMEDSATSYYAAAKEIFQRQGNYKYWVHTNINLSSILEDEKPARSVALLLEADSLTNLLSNRVQQALIQEYLYTIHSNNGNYKRALHHLENYHALKDSMLNKDFKTEELNVRYKTSKQKELIERQKTENLEKELALTKAHAKNEQLIAWGSVCGIGIIAFLVVTFWRRRTEKEMHQKELVHLEGVKKLEAAQAMLAGQEKERARVAEDLHDRLGSILTAAQMQFDASRDERNTDAEYNFLKGQSLLSRAINDTRTISHNLISGVLTNLGLASALRDLKESIEASDKLKVELEVETVPRFDINTELQLFRAAQEVVHNSVKHSGASTISIALWTHGKSLFLSIEDNGKGFDVGAVNKGLGLKNIERRISSIEGTCNFRTAPGKGCFFSVELQIASYENTENTHSR